MNSATALTGLSDFSEMYRVPAKNFLQIICSVKQNVLLLVGHLDIIQKVKKVL